MFGYKVRTKIILLQGFTKKMLRMHYWLSHSFFQVNTPLWVVLVFEMNEQKSCGKMCLQEDARLSFRTVLQARKKNIKKYIGWNTVYFALLASSFQQWVISWFGFSHIVKVHWDTPVHRNTQWHNHHKSVTLTSILPICAGLCFSHPCASTNIQCHIPNKRTPHLRRRLGSTGTSLFPAEANG